MSCNRSAIQGSRVTKTSLEHWSETQRCELARSVEILFSELEAAIVGGPSEAKRQGRIVKVTLFNAVALTIAATSDH